VGVFSEGHSFKDVVGETEVMSTSADLLVRLALRQRIPTAYPTLSPLGFSNVEVFFQNSGRVQ
jgi:hypothetical protein